MADRSRRSGVRTAEPHDVRGWWPHRLQRGKRIRPIAFGCLFAPVWAVSACVAGTGRGARPTSSGDDREIWAQFIDETDPRSPPRANQSLRLRCARAYASGNRKRASCGS
jgi:hypothetical protein